MKCAYVVTCIWTVYMFNCALVVTWIYHEYMLVNCMYNIYDENNNNNNNNNNNSNTNNSSNKRVSTIVKYRNHRTHPKPQHRQEKYNSEPHTTGIKPRFHLCFITWFVCTRKWCIDKLGIFHANQTSMCLEAHHLVLLNMFKPSNDLITDHSKAVLLLLICFVISVSRLYLLHLSCLFLAALWSPTRKGLTSCLSCVWCFLVPYGVSGQVWYLIYRFLIFAFFFTFIAICIYKDDCISCSML